jgi:predicted deacetylase
MNFSELRQRLEQLRAARQTVDVFFRDDDVDEDEATLWCLLNTFLFLGVPLNLQVIPGKLKTATVRLLRQQQQTHPTLIELNQHGWTHTNHETEGRKCEFGASRNFHAQLADIARGKAVLDDAFGAHWHPVFTPPWNRCTADTLRALDQLGFRVFSKDRGKEQITSYGFTEISMTLDLYRWRPRATMKSPTEIERELIAQLQRREPLGILLHHKVMDTVAFSLLASLLDELRRFPVVRFHTFASLVTEQYRER